MRSLTAPILLVILAVAIAGYGFSRMRTSAIDDVPTQAISSTSVPAASSSMEASNPEDDLKTYRNSAFCFEFSFPTMGGWSVGLSDWTESSRRRGKPYLLNLQFDTPPRSLSTGLNVLPSSVEEVSKLNYDYHALLSEPAPLVATSTMVVAGIPALRAEVNYPSSHPLGKQLYIHLIHRGNLLTWITVIDDSFSKELTEAFIDTLRLY